MALLSIAGGYNCRRVDLWAARSESAWPGERARVGGREQAPPPREVTHPDDGAGQGGSRATQGWASAQ